MKNRNLKKQQRFVNYLIRRWNKNLKNDPAYRGCFKVVQTKRYTAPYCDGSGESKFLFKIAFVSNKTGEIIDISGWIEVFSTDKDFLSEGMVNSRIFNFLNDAIVIKAKFWENKSRWV